MHELDRRRAAQSVAEPGGLAIAHGCKQEAGAQSLATLDEHAAGVHEARLPAKLIVEETLELGESL
jgi:hypothetical protein